MKRSAGRFQEDQSNYRQTIFVICLHYIYVLESDGWGWPLTSVSLGESRPMLGLLKLLQIVIFGCNMASCVLCEYLNDCMYWSSLLNHWWTLMFRHTSSYYSPLTYLTMTFTFNKTYHFPLFLFMQLCLGHSMPILNNQPWHDSKHRFWILVFREGDHCIVMHLKNKKTRIIRDYLWLSYVFSLLMFLFSILMSRCQFLPGVHEINPTMYVVDDS